MNNRILRNITWGVGPVLLVAIAYAAQASSGTTNRVKRGEYIVKATGCNDCHTPWKMGPEGPEPDMTRMLSGHPETNPVAAPPVFAKGPWTWGSVDTNTAFGGEWGVTYAFNLTPDRNTGIGIWTEEMFVQAIRTGKHMGVARPIMPPMPWKVYRNLTDDDLKSVYAYLRTIPPVVNHVPDYLPPAPVTTTAAGAR